MIYLGLRYLNSGFYIGYVRDVYAIIKHIIDDLQMKPSENDQKYFHYIYMDGNLRKKHNIKLDHYSRIVFNLWDVNDDEFQMKCLDGTLM